MARWRLTTWRQHAAATDGDRLLFATRSGKPIAPNNVLRRWVFPACQALVPRNVAHVPPHVFDVGARKGVPIKIVAQIMGHAKVDTTPNVYTQVVDASLRAAIAPVGAELFTILHSRARASALIH